MGTMGQGADPRTLATFGVAVRMSQKDGSRGQKQKVRSGLHQHEKRVLAVPSALGSQA